MSIFENRLIDSVTGKLLSTFRMGGLIKFVLSIKKYLNTDISYKHYC